MPRQEPGRNWLKEHRGVLLTGFLSPGWSAHFPIKPGTIYPEVTIPMSMIKEESAPQTHPMANPKEATPQLRIPYLMTLVCNKLTKIQHKQHYQRLRRVEVRGEQRTVNRHWGTGRYSNVLWLRMITRKCNKLWPSKQLAGFECFQNMMHVWGGDGFGNYPDLITLYHEKASSHIQTEEHQDHLTLALNIICPFAQSCKSKSSYLGHLCFLW